jgi:hypothetical protein
MNIFANSYGSVLSRTCTTRGSPSRESVQAALALGLGFDPDHLYDVRGLQSVVLPIGIRS